MEEILNKPDKCVLSMKSIFDFLQKRDLKFLNPIDVTSLIDLEKSPDKTGLSKIYLWNQVSDPNLGIYDFLKIHGDGVAEFKYVVVDGELIPLANIYGEESNPSQVQLVHVMNTLFEENKFPSYFVAEGNYEGVDGIHFSLTPFNDTISCDVLETLFGSDLVEKFKDKKCSELPKELKNINLSDHLNTDAIQYCNEMFIEHFKNSLRLVTNF